MKEALKEAYRAQAYGDVPIGAVVVKDGEIIARGRNQREVLRDATAHAEVIAIREASKQLGGWHLTGCSLYVTIEPCVMCAGALVMARMSRLVFGAPDYKAGGVVSLYQMLNDSRLNHQVEVVQGVMQEECSALIKEFFRNLRERGKRY